MIFHVYWDVFFSGFFIVCKLYNRLIWKNSIEIAIISRRNGPRCSCLKPIKILHITSVSKKISKCNNLKLILAHFYNEAKIRFVLICYVVSGRASNSCKNFFLWIFFPQRGILGLLFWLQACFINAQNNCFDIFKLQNMVATF